MSQILKRTLEVLRHPLTWIVLLGFLVRLYGVSQFPVIHDEIHSILDGVNKTKVSPIHFFFRASLKHTMGITPIYFWIERLFTDIFGQNNWGLRLFPLLSGVVTPLLAYYVVRKRFDQDLAIVAACLAAFSDIFIWTTTKAQFFEVLLIPLFLLIFYFATSENKHRFLYVSLFFSLALLTNFGKAFLPLLCFLLWYSVVKWFGSTRLNVQLRDLMRAAKRDLIQLVAFFSLVLLWIVGAQLLAFYSPISSTVGGGELHNMWEAIYNFTFGYGTVSKQAWVGSLRGAFFIFNDTNIWPVSALLFVPLVAGLVILTRDCVTHWQDKDEGPFKRDSYILMFALIPLFLLFSKGVIGARFHLFYFSSFIVACAIALRSLVHWFKNDKARWLAVIFVFLLGTYSAYSSSWENWSYAVWDERRFCGSFLVTLLITLVFGAAAFLRNTFREKLAQYFLRSFLALLFVILLVRGPLVWGTGVYSDPDPVNKLFDLEGNEEAVMDYAVQRNQPEICNRLEEYKEQCLSLVSGQR